MKFIELMQRANIKNFGVAKSYLKSAFVEIESRYPELITESYTGIVKDQRYYATPSEVVVEGVITQPDMIGLRGLAVKYAADGGETKYRHIPRIKLVEDIDQDGI